MVVMIMLRDKRQVDVKTRRIAATGGAVGISLAATLVGLSARSKINSHFGGFESVVPVRKILVFCQL